MSESTHHDEATFIFDDGCPLCRGYTAVFEGLGWAGRSGFSGLDASTLADLDLDRGRHHIPLHDPATGDVAYGLDGILSVIGANAPWLGRIGSRPWVRRRLDSLYWFITYNRRHIVASEPPATGFDCAPDFEPTAVRAYQAACAGLITALAMMSDTELASMSAVIAAGILLAFRSQQWHINTDQALGHIGSVATAGTAVGAAAAAITGSAAVATAGVLAVSARKMWLRRWMLRSPRPAST